MIDNFFQITIPNELEQILLSMLKMDDFVRFRINEYEHKN